MVVGRLAKRYARALFSLTRESAEATAEELGRAAAAVDEPRMKLLLASPVVDNAARRRIAQEVSTALRASTLVTNTIALLAERDRLMILPDVARAYEELIDEELGRARITIRSATPLTPSERTDLVELARRLTGCREVLATTEVDAELVGGVVLDVDGTVYDGSVRAQLARLSKQMTEGGA